MKQEEALNIIAASLKQDSYVQAVFVKGSMGRGEQDEHSDIDLYCLVDEKNETAFLNNRVDHLRAYRELLFYEDIFIIAPQIVAVYDNLLHADLFTVTEKSFKEKDYFRVLYDPENRIDQFKATQNLTVSYGEFQDDVMDVAWFLFQHKKSAARGNDIWSVKMLNYVVNHLARVLLHHHCPNRAQLGLKTVERSLPDELVKKFSNAMEHNTPGDHGKAAKQLATIVSAEKEWILSTLDESGRRKIGTLLEEMLSFYSAGKVE
ncbi:nucleotidyltransferase domain-containing protein [Virgibacillus doumboii]|uniref:nucleotidyltransferase domain-containing protein n=1 Tax=Virgibacillus doumboii TaxID=2697503 RepID=UPI0013DFC29C|nr:nucleotidyltransferase domain-containing protein [Virgibacillus doumboii]